MSKNLCRACLISQEDAECFQNMEMSFSEENLSIGFIFTRVSRIRLDPNDGLPQKICQNCFEELSVCYNFQKKCIESDTELRNLINPLPEETDVKYVKIEIDESNPIEECVNKNNWTGLNEEDQKDVKNNLSSFVEEDASPGLIEEKKIFEVKKKSLFEKVDKSKQKRKRHNHKCEKCNHTFDRPNKLQRHLKRHKPDEILQYSCKFCDFLFSKQTLLSRHLKDKHVKPSEHFTQAKIEKFLTNEDISDAEDEIEYISDLENKLNTSDVEDKPIIYELDEKELNVQAEKIQEDDIPLSNLIVSNGENKSREVPVISTSKDYDVSDDEIELPNPKYRRKTIHKCEICGKVFDRKSGLKRHFNIHNPEGRPYECPICKWRFVNENNLNRHTLAHTENIIKDKPKAYRCQYCSRKFAKKESLCAHMRVHKASGPQPSLIEKNFKCQFCQKSFFKLSSLTRHLYTHDDEKEFKCSLCDKSFGRRAQVIDHMNWHKNIKPFQCKICDKAFTQNSTLTDHMRSHTNEKTFLCSQCGKGFNTAANLRQHVFRHTGAKPFKCSECPGTFDSKGHLKAHMSIHTKIKPHVCNLCGASFTRGYSLKKHEKLHKGEKPYQCETCNMRFTGSSHLKRHTRTHTGEKPYQCTFCERAFAQSGDLRKHLKSHLGDNIYKCEKCGKSFRLQTELRDHSFEHYREEQRLKQMLDPNEEGLEIQKVLDSNQKESEDLSTKNNELYINHHLLRENQLPKEMKIN